MVDMLDSKREAIAQLCVRYGVSRLEVFGSALRDDFRPGESDVDLLVELGPMESYARVDAYFGMLDEYGFRKQLRFVWDADDSAQRTVLNLRVAYSPRPRLM